MAQYLEFIGNHPFLFLAAAALLALLITGELRGRLSGVRAVSSNDAVRLMNSGARVLDVRSSEAFRKGHLHGAEHVPLAELDDHLPALSKQPEQAVLVYCDAGFNSVKAAARLKKAGLAQVAHLAGGINAWQRDNLPVVKK